MSQGSDDCYDGRRNRGHNRDLSSRIEGFGNAPMPPPVSDSIADRFWDVVQEDKTLSDWFNFGKECLDDVVETFDGAVNAVVDAVDTMVDAVDGPLDGEGTATEGDPTRGQYRHPQGSGDEREPDDAEDGDLRRKAAKTKEKVKARRNSHDDDNGERSGIDWQTAVSTICEEGNLEDFVVSARGNPKSPAEERTIGDLLADELLNAVSMDNTLRILHVMQACVEGDLSVVMNQTRSRCGVKLKKLQSQACFKKLAADILGAESEQRAEEHGGKQASVVAPQQDLLDMPAESAPAARKNTSGVAASQGDTLDLLDMGAAPAAVAQQDDLFGFDFQSAPAAQPALQQAAAGSANIPRLLPPPDAAGVSPSAQRDEGLISMSPVASVPSTVPTSSFSSTMVAGSYGDGAASGFGGYAAAVPGHSAMSSFPQSAGPSGGFASPAPATDLFAAFPAPGAAPPMGVRPGPVMPPMLASAAPAAGSPPRRPPAAGGGASAAGSSAAGGGAFGEDLGDAFQLMKMRPPAVASASSSSG